MTGTQFRRPVPDRARRRAVRALAARLGVPYSVAARLLATPAPVPVLFADREHRPYHLRVGDTRRAADLPLGRAARLAERFPPPHRARYPDGRQTALAMLYAVLAHESPALLPSRDELAWVADLGEEAAVDVTCEALDRAARRLLDGDRWRLWTRIEAALAAGETSPDRRVRDAAIVLGRELRAVSLRRALDDAGLVLDALLAPPDPTDQAAGPAEPEPATT
jgi:hypothetical protein